MADHRSVLLVMDFQHAVVERLGNPDVLRAAQRALGVAREHDLPVMFVRVGFRPGFPEVAATNRAFSGLAGGGTPFGQDDVATQVHADLEPRDDEPVVLKRRVSAFSGSDLDVLLRAAGADSLVLAGISTSGVVLSTLRQAADLDYRLTVLTDACADRDAEVHRVLLENVFPGQAAVMSTEEWAASL
ncbi:MAG: cysteine hydrolase family protein [Marmoricola sp.]